MQYLGLIFDISNTCLNKCEICVKSKLTKNPCLSTQRENELLSLIHIEQEDLKHTMTRSGKKYYVTFIDDF